MGAMTRSTRPSLFARTYARIAPRMDARGAAAHRADLVAGLSGSVVEVGCGPGGMFRHYPGAVTDVVAVEPDDYLRGIAEREAAARPAPPTITVRPGTAAHLPLATGSVDAVVFSLVLCSVPDVAEALAEARRVLRRDGQVRFYEHVRSTSRILAAVEDVITPLWRRVAGHCHPNRDTVASFERAGLEVTRLRRFGFGPAALGPRIAHVIGTAVVR